MRAANSSDGSRVSLSSDQSLNDYEAYRSGDRFYVRLPRTNVSSGQAARGRGFDDVSVQHNGNGTLLSFRLQPGATARVEQRSNQLEVVFKAAGAPTVSTATLGPETTTRPNRVGPLPNIPPANGNRSNNQNPPARVDGSGSSTSSATPVGQNSTKNVPSPSPSPVTATAASASPRNTPSTAASSQTNQGASTVPRDGAARGSSAFRDRLRYWMLLASLNPVPVAVGLIVLILLIALLFLSRRRARDVHSDEPKRTAETKPGAMKSAVDKATKKASRTAVSASTPPVTTTKTETEVASTNGDQDPRMSRVAEQVKQVLAGEGYDPAVIATDDPPTRRIVAAELLSALAGRNGERQDRAREVFMNHGYFEDATRDLRIAESPAERAAAARRLSFVRDADATPHLTAALEDSAPEVRRAAVEALLDQHDPEAVEPLKELLRSENDRQVPHELIRRAIDASATNGLDAQPVSPTPSTVETIVMPPEEFDSKPDETEREVIEL